MLDKMQIKLINENKELNEAAKVLMELRPQYSFDSIVRQIRIQQQEGYQLVSAWQSGSVLGVAGFVIAEKLAWGRHIYVDDLVTSEQHRSLGVGRSLIQWLTDYGRKHNCLQIHLDSGVQRHDAHRFYLLNGFDIVSHHFFADIRV